MGRGPDETQGGIDPDPGAGSTGTTSSPAPPMWALSRRIKVLPSSPPSMESQCPGASGSSANAPTAGNPASLRATAQFCPPSSEADQTLPNPGLPVYALFRASGSITIGP